MSDLTVFRDHARHMATVKHKLECQGWGPRRGVNVNPVWPDPDCPGCVSDSERALWAQLADEVDAYLADDHDDEGVLFG